MIEATALSKDSGKIERTASLTFVSRTRIHLIHYTRASKFSKPQNERRRRNIFSHASISAGISRHSVSLPTACSAKRQQPFFIALLLA